MAKKTFHGSCVCKRIKFEADIDFADGTHKCNCTICFKRRAWTVRADPAGFRVTAGEDAFDPSKRFCAECGTVTYSHVPEMEWNPKAYVAIAVASLDDLDPVEAIEAKVTYYDGLADNWWNPPAETRHL